MEEGESENNVGNVDDSEWSDCNSDEENGEGQGESAKEKVTEADAEEDEDDENSLRIDLDATPSTSLLKKPLSTPKTRAVKSRVNKKGRLTRANKAKARATLVATGSESAKRRRKRRQRLLPTEAVPKSVVEAAAADNPDLDEKIDASAAKLGLNRTQVKGVLKQVLQSPDLFSVIMEKAGESTATAGTTPAEKFTVEPRVTRTKARHVKEDGGRLDWVLEKIEAMNNPKTPAKMRSKRNSGSGDKTDEDLSLLPVMELPEEDPDDVEYDPKKDPEAANAAGSDDEESLMTNSEVGTPQTQASNLFSSPQSSNFSAATPVPSGQDMLETPRPQAAATSSASKAASSAARNLSFDCPPPPAPPPLQGLMGGSCDPNLGKYHSKQQQQSEAVQRQTRSRSNLKDVPIEQLEVQLVAPDITPDMYDMTDYDYAQFCQELYYKPVMAGDNPETPREDPEEADPDYSVQQDQEMLLEPHDEFQFDRSTKVSHKELDTLVNDVIQAYDLDVGEEGDGQARDGDKGARAKRRDPKELLDEYYKEMEANAAAEAPPQLSQEQLWALNHQVRQHIQLLTSMTMLTSGYSGEADVEPELRLAHKVNENCKTMMSELYADVVAKTSNNLQVQIININL